MREYIIAEDVIDNALQFGAHFLKGKKRKELIRCKDCVHCYPEHPYKYWCGEFSFASTPDFYCKAGERREQS